VNCANATIKQAYSYGADGNRVMVTKGAAKTYEFVGADGQQLLGFEAATNKLTDYIYLGDVKIAQKEKTGAAAAVVSYLHNDLLGSPILSTNAAGATLWKETYQPYGAPHVKSVGKVGRQTGYLGKPYEEATGLSYLGARYYNPMLGRFLSIDPVGIVPSNIHSPNRYAYANNNPLTYKDPRGQLPIVIPIIIIGSGIVSAAIASSQGNDSSWTGFDKSFSKFWQNYIQDLARDLTPKPILNENSNAFNDNQDLTNTDNLDVSSSEMLPNDEDPGEDNGNQAKKLSSKEIGQKVERGDWHKTKLKSNLQKQYSRELRGSKNFDIYQNKETGNFFIQGNKSGNRIYIGKDLKNYL
jgi:RHS repeat-associated protein